ncbi:hypothetical protein BDV59DRAFT_180635 [Aspergillus ambiguus]|uniref:GNAT family N-acetyltransferase n=1 Tax=Aspergillus ambiguus TaxID=176160 RepID=UPI003CCDE7B5
MSIVVPPRALPSGLELKILRSPFYSSDTARVRFAAIQNNALNATMYPIASNPGGTLAWLEEREFHQQCRKDSVVTVIVDNTDGHSIAAYAKWRIPPRFLQNQATDGAKTLPKDSYEAAQEHSDTPSCPDGTNVELQSHFCGLLNDFRERHYHQDDDYILGSLYTHPRYQGRGCASAILHWGLQQAAENHARIYLESTPQARKLYENHGWAVIDQTSIDLRRFGGGGLYEVTAMIQEPRASHKGC